MNRAQRRRLPRQLRPIEAMRSALEQDLTAKAVEICDWIRKSDEPVPVRLEALDRTIADIGANPMYRLVSLPALRQLSTLRSELAGEPLS